MSNIIEEGIMHSKLQLKKNLQGSFLIIYEKLKNRLFHKLWKNCLADFFFYFVRMFFGS